MRPGIPILPMIDVATQPLKGATATAVRTKVNLKGVVELAISVIVGCFARLLGQRDRQKEIGFEALELVSLTKPIVANLLATDATKAPIADGSSLANRAALLQAAAANDRENPGALIIREQAGLAVATAVSTANQAIHQELRNRSGSDTAVANLKASLTDHKPKPVDLAPLKRFLEGSQRLAELGKYRKQLLAKTFERVDQNVQSKLLAMYEAALVCLVSSLLSLKLSQEIDKLIAKIDPVARNWSELAAKINDIRNALKQLEAQLAEQETKEATSAVLYIPGLSESEASEKLLASLRVSDIDAAHAPIAHRVELLLRAELKNKFPHLDVGGMSTRKLLMETPVETSARHYLDVIEELLGEVGSVYPLIERLGIGHVAVELYRRSSPTISIGSRNRTKFNISLFRATICRLPQPKEPGDAEIRKELVRQLRLIDKDVLIREASPDQQSVSIVRIMSCFPVGVMNDLKSMLPSYVQACQSGHLPHLVGIIPGSNVGAADSKTTQLWQTIERANQ